MMTRDSSTKLRSMRTPILRGVAIEVCASASNKVHNSFSRGSLWARDENVHHDTDF